MSLSATFDSELARRLGQQRSGVPSELFGDASAAFWLWVNTEGYRNSPAVRDVLPSLPEEQIQQHFTFRVGDDALIEGFGIYRLVRTLYERHVGDMSDAQGVLDFGCGWGRVIRFFLKDIDHRRLTGTDYNESLVDFCQVSNRWCTFVRNNAGPPLPFEEAQFDCIYAYSVFSHFSEEMHLLWLEELHRVLRPGGVLAVSVRPRDFIKHLGIRRKSEPEPESRVLLQMLPDTETELARYDAGGYCFSPYDASRSNSWWGEACIPRAYIDHEWARLFEVTEFVEGSPLNLDGIVESPNSVDLACEQHFVLLRR